MSAPDSTLSDVPDRPRRASGRWARRLGVALLAAVVLAGATGLLGPREADVSARAGGYELEVTYPAVTRAGQPAPLHVTVSRAGGFERPVELALCDDLFDHLDFQAWYPTPSAETGEQGAVVYEFDPPAGDVLEVSLDARSAPGPLAAKDTCLVELREQDAAVVSVGFTSWRMP